MRVPAVFFALSVTLGLTLTLPGMAGARCVSPGDLAQGVEFAREDGRTGRILPEGRRLAVNYDVKSPYWVDQRSTWLGVFELETHSYPEDELSVGGGVTDRYRVFVAAPPARIVPGLRFQSEVREKEVTHNSSEQGTFVDRLVYRGEWVALAPMQVKIGGCGYQVIPVEATWTGPDAPAFQRWLYFPDLGFGIETRQGGARFGLTRLAPVAE